MESNPRISGRGDDAASFASSILPLLRAQRRFVVCHCRRPGFGVDDIRRYFRSVCEYKVTKQLSAYCLKFKFHGTDTDFLAGVRERILARKSACPARAEVGTVCRGPFSSPTCPRTFVRHALFLARKSVGDTHVYTCTVHDKLSCTRLQNYTIGASLKSVSVPWNLSYYTIKLEPSTACMHATP